MSDHYVVSSCIGSLSIKKFFYDAIEREKGDNTTKYASMQEIIITQVAAFQFPNKIKRFFDVNMWSR